MPTLDRRIEFQRQTIVQDPATGFPAASWLAAADTPKWAERRDVTGSERFRSAQELATRTSVFKVRYFSGLNASEWRIRDVVDDQIFDIEGLAQPPRTRNQWWEVTAVAGEVSQLSAGPAAPTVDTEPPTVPTNLSAVAISGSEVDLTWDASTDNVGVTSYRIYRDALLIDTSATTSYSDIALEDETEYSYQVTALDAAGNESALSAADTATTGYIANAVNFDGTNDYLIRGAGLTGAADSKLWTGSLWARRAAVGVTQRIICAAGTAATVYFGSDNKVYVVGENSAGSVILILSSVITITDTAWHHFAWSVDLNDNAKSRLYVDDASSASSTSSNAAIDFTVANWSIGAQVDGTQKFAGDLAEVQCWFGQWLELDTEANRRLFRTAVGGRVDPATAAASALGNPIILFAGATSTWHINDGTGGGFTMNGLLTDGQAF